jgi:hypothetical protein
MRGKRAIVLRGIVCLVTLVIDGLMRCGRLRSVFDICCFDDLKRSYGDEGEHVFIGMIVVDDDCVGAFSY